MMEFTEFVYDRILSSDMKVTQVSVGGGLFEETFLANKTLHEDKIRGNDTPYDYGVDREPLVIPLSIWFDENITDEEYHEAANWLDQDIYKELYFPDKPELRFYAKREGDSIRTHNGIVKGVVNLRLRTNSPYPFTPVYSSEIYDLSNNTTSGTEIEFINQGDVLSKPLLTFEMVGNGDIKIINKSNGGLNFEMKNLLHGEIITVDNHYEDIETDAPGLYRYDNHNNIFLEMVRGYNYLQVFGKVKNLRFVSQFNKKTF